MHTVRGGGLEPPMPFGIRTSSVRVCQFHHPRTVGTRQKSVYFLVEAGAGAAGAGAASAAVGAATGGNTKFWVTLRVPRRAA